MGCPKSTVERVCRDNGLKPHRVQTFKFSNDPKFAEARLTSSVRGHIEDHHANPSSFVWTKKAEDILEKVARARAGLKKIPSA